MTTETPVDTADKPSWRRVRTAPGAKEQGVIAVERIAAGERILFIEGPLTEGPTRWSIQVGERTHVGLLPDPQEQIWRFLNHACIPNAMIQGRELVAIEPIEAGDEITFDYETTEYDIAEPFACQCGRCGGRAVRGFKHLSPAERFARAPLLASHLRRLVDDTATLGNPRAPGPATPPPGL